MATIHEIPAQSRKDEGRGASRRLRRAGQVPAIVYGGDQGPQSIQIDHTAAMLACQNEWFYSAILDLKLDGNVQRVLLRDMQRHPFKPQLLHLDFLRIDENREIRVRVPLHFLNQEMSPAGKISGVAISHALTDIEISCLPKDLPEYVAVDLAALQVGDIVHMSDLKLPEGVEIPELRLGREHDAAVVTAQEVREEVEPETEVEGEVADAEAAAAPSDEEADDSENKDDEEK